MSDLTDLFSTNSPPRSPPRRPAKPLFLSPSASFIAPTPQSRRTKRVSSPPSPPPPPPQLDLYDDFDLPDSPPPLPERGALPPTTGIGAGTGVGWVDPLAGLDIGRGDDREGPEKVGKKRKPIPKIDADRLLGENGFPALMRAAKRFKPRGKGHEAADLRDLLGVYQLWAHGMFPKGDFASTIARVENVCRTRRMENALKGYREAFYPPARSPTPLSPRPEPTSNAEDGPLSPPSEQGDAPAPVRKEPPFEPAQEGDNDELEEMMTLVEMERDEARRRPVEAEDGPPLVEEEDEWEGLYD